MPNVKLPVLYHKGKKGAIHSWKIWTEDADIITEHGQVDGKKQIARKTAVGKNTGKKNETSGQQQAILEAASMHKYKLDRKYSLTPEKAKEPSLLPMLALDFEKCKKKDVVYPGDVQPKLDGVRCLARWNDKDNIELISRNGKPYNVPHVIKELGYILDKEDVFDGELYIHGVGFQTISSWIKKFRPETAKIEYHVYDIPESMGIDVFVWEERNDQLKTLQYQIDTNKLKSIKTVKSYTAKNEREVKDIQAKFVQDGYEGAIFRNLRGPYMYDYRSHDLLKVKTFDDNEFEIVGHTDGVGKDKGMVVWICKTKKGDIFNVRPDGKYEIRKQHFQDGEKYVGQMFKVKYFGMTDEGIPRFPIGLGFRLEEDQ